jgi:hypothetical protein
LEELRATTHLAGEEEAPLGCGEEDSFLGVSNEEEGCDEEVKK